MSFFLPSFAVGWVHRSAELPSLGSTCATVGQVVVSARVAATRTADQIEPTHEAVLIALTDAELVMAWQSSCTRLARIRQMPNRTVATAALAIERSWYLDEMDRRRIDVSRVVEQW